MLSFRQAPIHQNPWPLVLTESDLTIVTALPGLKTYEMASPAGKSSFRKCVTLFLHAREALSSLWTTQRLPRPAQRDSVRSSASAPCRNAEPGFKRENENEVFWQSTSSCWTTWDGAWGTCYSRRWLGARPVSTPGPTFPHYLPSLDAPDQPADKTLGLEQRHSSAVWQPEKISWHSSFLFSWPLFFLFFFSPPEATLAPRQIRRRVHYKARNIKRSKRKAKLLAETKIACFLFCHGKAKREHGELSVLRVILVLWTNSAKIAKNKVVDGNFYFIIIFLNSANCRSCIPGRWRKGFQSSLTYQPWQWFSWQWHIRSTVAKPNWQRSKSNLDNTRSRGGHAPNSAWATTSRVCHFTGKMQKRSFRVPKWGRCQ